jgi:uracil-DNA glycosylase
MADRTSGQFCYVARAEHAASRGRAVSPASEGGAAPFVPDSLELAELSAAAAGCRGCELYRDATMTVFGAGGTHPSIVLVGEQPGDTEDVAGEPFVGPAGRLLDRALAEAEIERRSVYLTNAVKHFRFTRRDGGQRRIHEKPSAANVQACRPWLLAELRATTPAVVVLLGATAAQAVMGRSFRVTQQRGRVLPWPPDDGPFADIDLSIDAVVATVHPSAVLRTPSPEREAAFAALVSDLQVAARAGS